MKTIFILFLFACFSFSMQDVPALNTFQDSAVITATPFNQNFDTLSVSINRNRDTVENKFIRFSDLTNGDSTLSLLKTDSQQTRTISATGTIITSGKIIGDSLSIRAIDSHYTDSIEARRGIHAPLFRGPLIGDVTGNITGGGSINFTQLNLKAQTITPVYGLNQILNISYIDTSKGFHVCRLDTTLNGSGVLILASGNPNQIFFGRITVIAQGATYRWYQEMRLSEKMGYYPTLIDSATTTSYSTAGTSRALSFYGGVGVSYAYAVSYSFLESTDVRILFSFVVY